MNADDLQELYKLVRGSRAANMVLDARALFQEQKMAEALKLLVEAREKYAEGRTRLFRQKPDERAKGKAAEREAKRITRKQDKARDNLKQFDELCGQLEKLAERQQRSLGPSTTATSDTEKTKQPSVPSHVDSATDDHESRVARSADSSGDATGSSALSEGTEQESVPHQPSAPDNVSIATPADMAPTFKQAFPRSTPEEQIELVGRHFGFREVAGEQDIHADALYFIHSGEKTFLVRTLKAAEGVSDIPLAGAIDGQLMKPFSRKAFLKLGKKRKMVLLTVKGVAEQDEKVDRPNANDCDQTDGDEDSSSEGTPEAKVIDVGSFSQLLTSAQRSGLVPAADQIGHVRDREFRMGKYDLAFQTINGLFSKFTASMNQRNQRLIREDADIASGKVKMSPKDLQAKRARDLRQTQEIDRARRRFQVVLEGLRLLMNTTEAS